MGWEVESGLCHTLQVCTFGGSCKVWDLASSILWKQLVDQKNACGPVLQTPTAMAASGSIQLCKCISHTQSSTCHFCPAIWCSLADFTQFCPEASHFSVLHHRDDVNPVLPCNTLKCSRSHFILIKVSQLWPNYVVCCLQYTCTDAFTAYLSLEKMSSFSSLWFEILIKPIFIEIEGIQS